VERALECESFGSEECWGVMQKMEIKSKKNNHRRGCGGLKTTTTPGGGGGRKFVHLGSKGQKRSEENWVVVNSNTIK